MEIELIAGNFLEPLELPKDKEYLYKYFLTDLQKQVLAYYLVFKPLLETMRPYQFYQCFWDHTGMVCARKVINRYIKRYELLEAFMTKLKAEGNLEKIAEIRTGNFNIYEFGTRDI